MNQLIISPFLSKGNRKDTRMLMINILTVSYRVKEVFIPKYTKIFKSNEWSNESAYYFSFSQFSQQPNRKDARMLMTNILTEKFN